MSLRNCETIGIRLGTVASINDIRSIYKTSLVQRLGMKLVDDKSFALIKGHEKLKQLIGEKKLQQIESTDTSLLKLYENRLKVLREFHESLQRNSTNESYRQKFFEENDWIFGYGLDYQFLHNFHSQSSYGGKDFTGKGNQKGDFLNTTGGESAKFIVLVELKTPNTKLCEIKDNYGRNGIYPLSSALLNGISQIQINCETWNKEGSTNKSTAKKLENNNIFTINPKGILVIGMTAELDTDEKKNTFQALRTNIKNPDIITFDELYKRAEYIVKHTENEKKQQQSKSSISLDDDLSF